MTEIKLKKKKKAVKRIDEDAPLRVEKIDDRIPRPIGAYLGEHTSNNVIRIINRGGIRTPAVNKGNNNKIYYRDERKNKRRKRRI